jgi:hypothetical protein
LRLQIREHLPIGGLDLGENFIDSRDNTADKLDHVGDLSSQLLHLPLALFKTSIEIAHRPPS